jgi:hypothetical protein
MRLGQLRRESRLGATVGAAASLLNLSSVVARADKAENAERLRTSIEHVVVSFPGRRLLRSLPRNVFSCCQPARRIGVHASEPFAASQQLLNAGLLAPPSDREICTGDAPSLDTQQGRCGYGPRLPLLVISPLPRTNDVDHGVTDQAILRFIEDNWGLGRIGVGSFDAIAGSLLPLFDFN